MKGVPGFWVGTPAFFVPLVVNPLCPLWLKIWVWLKDLKLTPYPIREPMLPIQRAQLVTHLALFFQIRAYSIQAILGSGLLLAGLDVFNLGLQLNDIGRKRTALSDKFLLRPILVGRQLQLLANGCDAKAMLTQYPGRERFLFSKQAQQQMFRADVLIGK